ncbi:hypothetical protein HY932_00200 [Candidatus Falkowbacteria bacterium]|nr:hypothetical protein [Candidatus Falkowbacteria bacterium]
MAIGTLKKLIWFANPRKINVRRDKNLIIHQTLSMGSLGDIKKLFSLYSKKEIRESFLRGRRGLYDPKVLELVKFMLGIKKIDKNKYVKKIR